MRAVLVYDAGLMTAGTRQPVCLGAVHFPDHGGDLRPDAGLSAVVRDRAVGRSKGVWPRVFGVVGTFMGVGILQLPVARLDLPMQLGGSGADRRGQPGLGAGAVAPGQELSILPEAPRMVMSHRTESDGGRRIGPAVTSLRASGRMEKLLPRRHSTSAEPRLPTPISTAATSCMGRSSRATGSCRMPTP